MSSALSPSSHSSTKQLVSTLYCAAASLEASAVQSASQSSPEVQSPAVKRVAAHTLMSTHASLPRQAAAVMPHCAPQGALPVGSTSSQLSRHVREASNRVRATTERSAVQSAEGPGGKVGGGRGKMGFWMGWPSTECTSGTGNETSGDAKRKMEGHIFKGTAWRGQEVKCRTDHPAPPRPAPPTVSGVQVALQGIGALGAALAANGARGAIVKARGGRHGAVGG